MPVHKRSRAKCNTMIVSSTTTAAATASTASSKKKISMHTLMTKTYDSGSGTGSDSDNDDASSSSRRRSSLSSKKKVRPVVGVSAMMIVFVAAAIATTFVPRQQHQNQQQKCLQVVTALNFNGKPAMTKKSSTFATGTFTSTLLSMSSKDSSSSGAGGNGGESLSPETAFGAEVVPEGQRPVNEYLDMKRAPLFGWASNEVGLNGLLQRLGLFYVLVFVTLGFPISGATFTQDGYLLQKVAAANVGTLGLVLVLLIRLYSGWGYVGARLKSKVIEYEESGWYDGNMEMKTEAEFKRDQFLYKSDVQPAAERVKNLTLGAAALWVASCVALNTAVAQKPIFDEYDPSVLERVRYDDTYASEAAKASANKPTYCDNRYYRAVAGGGQGCNF